jgi:hypothetical protein
MAEDLIPVGTKVAATYPNERWGSGVIIDADRTVKVAGPSGRKQRRKPYIVEREDGTLGYFHDGQIAPVETAADAAEGN